MKKNVMKKTNSTFIHHIVLNSVLCLVLLFVSSILGSKSAHADMYKYVKKDGSTLLTAKRLRGSRYRLVKVYKIKKKRAYRSSSRKKKRSKTKKSKYRKGKKKRFSKNRKKLRSNKKRKSKRFAKKHKKSRNIKRKKNKSLGNIVKANGRDNGIITGCHSYKHLSRQARIYQKTIKIYAQIYNVDAELIHAIVRQESCFNEGAHSRVGAIGLMQLMPQTALGLRINDPWNPEHNIQGGIKYIAQMLKTFNGDSKLAIAAYNAGPGNVSKYGGIPPFKETQNYVKKVYAEYKRLKRDGIHYPKEVLLAQK